MKPLLAQSLIAVFIFTSAAFLFAGDFVSMVMQATQSLPTITVPGDRFLVIRNFTQEVGATNRGFVSVITNGLGPATVLTATIVDPSASATLEVINNVVIAGPATVNVTCGDTTNCFITYRKGAD